MNAAKSHFPQKGPVQVKSKVQNLESKGIKIQTRYGKYALTATHRKSEHHYCKKALETTVGRYQTEKLVTG